MRNPGAALLPSAAGRFQLLPQSAAQGMVRMNIEPTQTTVQALVRGAVDLRGQGGPLHGGDARDLLDLARDAEAAGLRAVVFMDPDFSPAPLVQTLRRHEFSGRPISLLSGVELNNTVGGLNPYAVEHELMLGGRVISMPTVSAAHRIRNSAPPRGWRVQAPAPHAPALEVIGADGQLRDEVRQILDLVAAHDAVLCSGGLHVAEIWPLFLAARQRGVTRLLVNDGAAIGLTELRELALFGAFIEVCVEAGLQCGACLTRTEVPMALIAAATTRQTILVPGRTGQDGPGGRFRAAVQACLALGYDAAEIRQITSDNAARLLGLAPDEGKTA